MFDFPELGIRLRGFEGDKDLDQILLMHNDREIASLISLSYIIPPAPAKFKEDFKKIIENSAEIFCVIESIPESKGSAQSDWDSRLVKEQPEWIGFVALFGSLDGRLRRESAYAISIWKRYWSKGYGTAVTKFIVQYAFESLFMHRIKLSVFDGNDRAVALYKECGFVLEGRERKALRSSDGGWKDIINMGMIIDDWIEMRNTLAAIEEA